MKANQRALSVVLVRKRASFIAGLCITLTVLSGSAFAQLGPYDRDSARSMLEAVRDDLKKKSSFSFTPGFSPVIVGSQNRKEPFQTFSWEDLTDSIMLTTFQGDRRRVNR